MKRILYFLIFNLMLQQHAQAAFNPDSTLGSFGVAADVHYGFIIAHRASIVELQKDHVKGIEISLSKLTYGNKVWQRAYNFPTIGLKYIFLDLGNDRELGFGQALVPYFDFGLINCKQFKFNFQYGWGIGYIEKKFDVINNYKNTAIGTHWNATISFSANVKVKLFKQTFLSSSANLTHFSNGGSVVPNLGINIATVKAGVIQYIGSSKPFNRDTMPAFHSQYRNSFYIAGGVKQIYPVQGPNYYIAAFSASRLRHFSRKSAAGLALDVHYDKSVIRKLQDDTLYTKKSMDGTRAGVSATYELIFSDFSMVIQMGGYFYNQFKSEGNYYHRLGWRYNFSKNYFACFNLKAHWAKADFFEWGVGMKL